MKQKRKHILKKILIFGIAFLLASCSEELFDEAIESSNRNVKIRKISFNEFKKEEKAFNSLQKLKKASATSVLNRLVVDSITGFTIDTETIKEITTTDNYKSYTIFAVDETENQKVVNLLFSEKENGNYEVFMLKYNVTETEKAKILNNETVNLQNKTEVFTRNSGGDLSNPVRIDDDGNCYIVDKIWQEGNMVHWNILYVECPTAGTNGSSGSNNGGTGNTSGGFWTPVGFPGGSSLGNGQNGIPSGGSGEVNDIVLTEISLPDGTGGKTPCTLLNKLKIDTNFIGRMKGLAYASNQYGFEQLHVLYPKASPTPSNNYTYQNFQGNSSAPNVSYDGNTSMQGVIHSHYVGASLSIFSAQDLADCYQKMKDNLVTDDFFIGVVCPQGNAYIMQVNDRAAFITFGDKYLSTEKKIDDFDIEYCQKKYNIKMDNSPSDNEKGFVKMLKKMNIGTNIAKSTFVPSINITSDTTVFKNWSKLNYNENTETVEPQTCN